MSDEIAFDLLGDPIPANFGKRGRPPHIPTKSHRETVVIGLAQGWPDGRIASALGLTVKTFRKHYRQELKTRDIARDRIELIGLHTLFAMGRAGNVSAMKEYFSRHDAAAERDFEEAIRQQNRARPQKAEAMPEKLGKKALLDEAAQNPPDDWQKILN